MSIKKRVKKKIIFQYFVYIFNSCYTLHLNIMSELLLYAKIEKLPLNLKNEVDDFVDFIESKRKSNNIKNKKPRIFGYAKDSITIKPDFDEPLEEFKEYM